MLLTTGITPKRLALTVALGFVIGIIPFFGFATLLCTFIGIRFRLNIPAMLLICYLSGPFHVLLYIPFIQLGIWLFQAEDFRLSFDEIVTMIKVDWQSALSKLWWANMLGIIAWLLLSGPITGLIYMLMLPIFRKMVRVPLPKDI